ncbi:hypothetical protein [Bradyrhizobium brasilense]|uniref:hypothetical protein n=1 Tax=Bradyrhizobium brasilense TaxID=1419277 RepID=UPI001E63E090|nr:hypothetical protein [Bradyrhizobium brasilense]MCC8968967.1 hypothetical protein [Bradyrhizobium brasilense]
MWSIIGLAAPLKDVRERFDTDRVSRFEFEQLGGGLVPSSRLPAHIGRPVKSFNLEGCNRGMMISA